MDSIHGRTSRRQSWKCIRMQYFAFAISKFSRRWHPRTLVAGGATPSRTVPQHGAGLRRHCCDPHGHTSPRGLYDPPCLLSFWDLPPPLNNSALLSSLAFDVSLSVWRVCLRLLEMVPLMWLSPVCLSPLLLSAVVWHSPDSLGFWAFTAVSTSRSSIVVPCPLTDSGTSGAVITFRALPSALQDCLLSPFVNPATVLSADLTDHIQHHLP